MSPIKNLLIALVLTLTLPALTYAKPNCSDVKSKNRDECVRAKHGDNDRDKKVDRGGNNRKEDIDKDDVECRNAKDPDVRRRCARRKIN
jgi:hypothetical protein